MGKSCGNGILSSFAGNPAMVFLAVFFLLLYDGFGRVAFDGSTR